MRISHPVVLLLALPAHTFRLDVHHAVHALCMTASSRGEGRIICCKAHGEEISYAWTVLVWMSIMMWKCCSRDVWEAVKQKGREL